MVGVNMDIVDEYLDLISDNSADLIDDYLNAIGPKKKPGRLMLSEDNRVSITLNGSGESYSQYAELVSTEVEREEVPVYTMGSMRPAVFDIGRRIIKITVKNMNSFHLLQPGNEIMVDMNNIIGSGIIDYVTWNEDHIIITINA